MKRGFAIFGIAGVALMAFAGLKGTALDSFAQAINGAEGLEVNYTMTVVGGTTDNFSVSLAKPNMARVETPDMTVVADGKTITRYYKKDKIYYSKDQTKADLMGLFSENGLDTWLPFFNSDAIGKFASVKDAGTKTNRGVKYNVVEALADAKGDTKMTYFIDPSDQLAKKAEIVVTAAGKTQTTIMNATKAKITNVGNEVFAFKAPAGSKEVNEADMIAGKWLHNFDEALAASKIGDKLVMIDFMASWCGPCKMMDAEVFQTAEFKELTKGMVLVKIDVDEQSSLAAKYGINAMPTVKFVNSSGTVVHEFVGYGGPSQVLGEVKKAQSKHGK